MRSQALAALTISGLALFNVNAHAIALSDTTDRVSYAIGVDLAKKFKEQDIKINPDNIAQGIKDVQNNGKLQMTDPELADTFTQFQKSVMEKRMAEFQKTAATHAEAGKSYLAKNKELPGIKTTASGLQYKIIKAGKGASPKATDLVRVEYTGKTLDGKVFDSTEKAGKPAEFKVNQVIPGWQEALKLMRPGAVYEVVIPADLAYGPRGAGQQIGPNETLLFNIHLISASSK